MRPINLHVLVYRNIDEAYTSGHYPFFSVYISHFTYFVLMCTNMYVLWYRNTDETYEFYMYSCIET